MTLTLLIALTLYILSVPLVGARLASLSVRIWERKKNDKISFFFFPFHTIDREVGRSVWNFETLIEKLGKKNYLLLASWFWLPRWTLQVSLLTVALVLAILFGILKISEWFVLAIRPTICRYTFSLTPANERPNCS